MVLQQVVPMHFIIVGYRRKSAQVQTEWWIKYNAGSHDYGFIAMDLKTTPEN